MAPTTKKSVTNNKQSDSPGSPTMSDPTSTGLISPAAASTTAASVNQGVSSGAVASCSSSPMEVDEPSGDSAAGTQQSTVSIPSSSLVVAEPTNSGMHNLVQNGTQQSTLLNLGSLSNDSSTVNSSFSLNVNVPEEFASSITTDERLILLEEIERLKAAVFRATVTSIKCPQGTIVPENLGVLTRQFETAQKTYQLVFGNIETTVVPNETPYFQWRGHHFNKRRAIFSTPNDCLDHFERVMQAHRLSINENWERIVPAKLSTGMARWYANLIASKGRLNWTQFRTEVINKYGKSMVDMCDEAREQLERLLYQPGEAFNAFMDKFQQLRGQAEIQDEDCVVRYLIKALPEELANHTKFYLNTNADRGEINVDFAVTKITAIYNALFKDKWEKEKQFSSSTTTATSSSAPKIKSQYSSNSRSDKHKLKCIYHPQFSNHSTEDCNLSEDRKKRRLAANKKLSNHNKRPCMYCKEPNWTPEHNRVCKKLINKSKQKRRVIVPTPTSEETNSDDNMDTDTEDSEEQNLTFAAMNIKDCEYQYMKEPPRNLLNKNSIILPITLENNSIKIRTYFLLDTGSSFSCISPRLAKLLEVSIKKSIKGTVISNRVVQSHAQGLRLFLTTFG